MTLHEAIPDQIVGNGPPPRPTRYRNFQGEFRSAYAAHNISRNEAPVRAGFVFEICIRVPTVA